MTLQKKFLLGLAVVLFTLFFVEGPGYYAPRSLKAFWNLGHIGFYAILISLVPWQAAVLKNRHWFILLLAVIVFCGITGTFIELAQYGFDRDVDWQDIVRDILGGLLGFLFSPIKNTLTKSTLLALKIIVLCFLLVQLFPVGFALYDESLARRQFPLLADFETTSELDRWQSGNRIQIVEQPTVHGQKSLRIELGTELYSGISLNHFPGNWSGYQTLEFHIYNPDEKPIHITCRINDYEHRLGDQRYQDRYNRRFTLTSGWNKIIIDIDDIVQAPAQRQLAIHEVNNFGLFVVREPAPRTIYLDYLRLN